MRVRTRFGGGRERAAWPVGLAVAAILVFAVGAVGAPSEPAYRLVKTERIDDHLTHYQVESPFEHGRTLVRVLTPDKPVGADKRRVLFVLPVEAGVKDRWGDGLAEVRKQNLHNKHGLIVVAPTFSQLPWYADHPTQPTVRQESYMLKVVVPLVQKVYPTPPSRRLLIGFSKSGWGVYTLLLRHPDTFGAAAAWDAPLMKAKPDQFGMGPIFGTQSNFEQYQVSKLLTMRAALLARSTRLVLSGYGNFREHHVDAHALMTRLGVKHVYVDGPKRKHHWTSGWLPEAVAALVKLAK